MGGRRRRRRRTGGRRRRLAPVVRCAVVGSLDSIPWVPLFGGLLLALRSLGFVARPFALSSVPHLHVEELRDFGADVALFPVQMADLPRLSRYLEELPRARVRRVLVTFDDPYDIVTPLSLASEVDAVLTPEPMAVDEYLAAGVPVVHVMPPPIDLRMHNQEVGAPVPQVYDLAHVGETERLPRRVVLPLIRAAMRRAGRVYGEAAGKTRWVAGRDLTAFLASVGVLLDIPRSEVALRTNPKLLPCTWTAPRVHLAAACGCFVLGIDSRPDFSTLYPEFPTVRLDQAEEAVIEWTAPEKLNERRERASAALQRFHRQHAPSCAPARVIERCFADLGLETPVSPGCHA